MKRVIFLIAVGVPNMVVSAWAFGPLTFKGVVAVSVATITGYIWGITAPKHMHKFEMD